MLKVENAFVRVKTRLGGFHNVGSRPALNDISETIGSESRFGNRNLRRCDPMPLMQDGEARNLVELSLACETFHSLVAMAGAAGSHYAQLRNA
jgi:hypothetical protein